MKPQNHVICTKHRRYAEATKAFVHKRHRTGDTGQRCWIENKPDIESKPNSRCSRRRQSEEQEQAWRHEQTRSELKLPQNAS